MGVKGIATSCGDIISPQAARASIAGARNRSSGAMFEELIDRSCRAYAQQGTAHILKTPEPMRPIGARNTKGQFLACFTKRAQPDYQGTLKGGRSIVFEAKHTDTARIKQSVVTIEQERELNAHAQLGAECFVLVSFAHTRFFKVPWDTWRSMKQIWGRRYATPDDLADCGVRMSGGFLHFLEDPGPSRA